MGTSEERLPEPEPGNCVVCGAETRYRWISRCGEHAIREPEPEFDDE
jgi:hypothetical protein